MTTCRADERESWLAWQATLEVFEMGDAEAPKPGSRWERVCTIIGVVGTLLLLATLVVLAGGSWLLSNARVPIVDSDSPPDALALHALMAFARQAQLPIGLVLQCDLILLLTLGTVGRARWHW